MNIPKRLFRHGLVAFAAAGLAALPAAAAPSLLARGLSSSLDVAGFGMSGFGRGAPDQPRPRDQDRAFRATREGRSMPLPMIEQRVRPHMGGADYLGPEFRGETYRLKYMQGGHVIWVDVDAATGRIVRRSAGN